jgi:hypothetical protein
MTVYDCTMFHWEFDMLELRMKELWNVVDYFCVTESEVDHRGNPRELALTNNLDKFDWAKEKLVVNVSKDLHGANTTWDREKYQRFESLAHVLRKFENNIKDEDLFLISDTDEIFKSESVSDIIGNNGIFTFQMHMYYYYYNLYISEWYLAKAITANHLMNPNDLRMIHPQITNVIKDGGWHFSYIGEPEQIQYKLKTFAHDELDRPEFTDIYNIKNAIENKKDLFGRSLRGQISPLGGGEKADFMTQKANNQDWPKYLFENNKYKKFII